MDVGAILTTLLVVWASAKLAGEAMERLGQPAVLGELLAGVVIGPGVLGLVADSEVLHVLAEIGVVLLLFEIGLESDVEELLEAGAQSAVVALVGIAVPFAGGIVVARAFGHPGIVAVLTGAALTATSVGITARVLSDLGRLREAAARVILGAAVLDDILGLVILAVVSGIAATGEVSVAGAALILVKALAFVVAAIVLGSRAAPMLMAAADRMRARGSLIVYAVVFCVGLATIAHAVGLATIIGAFAAGLVLAKTDRRAQIDERIKPVADLFVPVFFVSVGLRVDPRALDPFGEGGGFVLALVAVALLAKLTAGLAVYRRGVRRWIVGVGMIPRGEVGLIFAGVGLASGAFGEAVYAAIVAMVVVTTFVVPPWLKWLYRS